MTTPAAAAGTASGARTTAALDAEQRHCAPNYHPLPVVLVEGEGSWVTDVEGRRYLDLLSAYSALNFGHRHPRLVGALERQLGRLTLTSRAFHNDQLGPFCAELAELCASEMVLPMNTGAEAVETAIKVARRWGYDRKGIAADRAEIIVFDGNFHGRTTTIVSFSDDPSARRGFGPFTPGFVRVPYGDIAAVVAATNDRTVAVLVEPVQGEAGVVLPPPGFLAALRQHGDERGVLLVADEIQSGLGRTGRTFACDHEGVVPDLYLLGKALGGGLLPVSAVVGRADVLGVVGPGEHGSTFGGNPLAAAVGREVISLLRPGTLQARAARLGAAGLARLRAARLPGVQGVRGLGLWWAVDLDEGGRDGRDVCEDLAARGVLAKDTHVNTVRFAPPLTIEERDLDHALDVIEACLRGDVARAA